MANKPVVLLDLDRMLFNTDKFMLESGQLLANHFGISAEAFQQTYPDFYVYNGDMRYNDFFKHMQSFGLEPDEVERVLEAGLAGHDLLYPDVPAFLTAVQAMTCDLMVLTHGEHRFQYLKYHVCTPLRSIEFKDVLTHKREYIAQRFAGRHGVLIDDHQVGELPDGFRHIWVSRYGADGAYSTLADAIPLLTD